jgi:hypothetical protein
MSRDNTTTQRSQNTQKGLDSAGSAVSAFNVVKVFFAAFAFFFAGDVLDAQRGRGGQPAGPPPIPRAAAPIDLTGYWVALITDDWRWRMVTPPKGDVLYLPVNAEGRRVAETWDPAKDEAAGEQCKGYAAPSLMHLPGRLHVSWQNDTTLVVEADAGTQTRVFHFGPPSPRSGFGGATPEPSAQAGGAAPQDATPSWQGHSIAQWEFDGPGPGRRGRPAAPPKHGSLKVVTTKLKPGYFRKNGVPYSANAVLTEYFTTLTDEGVDYLVVTNFLEDPQYLAQPYVRSVQFKKQADSKGWNPTACSAR